MGEFSGKRKKRPGSCPLHPDEPAILTCDVCHTNGCVECITTKAGKDYCPSCLKRHQRIRTKAGFISLFIFVAFSILIFLVYRHIEKSRVKKKSQVDVIVQFLKKHPDEQAGRWRLINLYSAKKQYRKAIYHLNILIESNPRNTRLLNKMVFFYFSIKDYKNTLLWIEKTKKIAPVSSELLNLEGDTWKNYGNEEECEKSWLSAFQLKPTDIVLAFKIEKLFRNQGRYKDAMRILNITLHSVQTIDKRNMVKKRIRQLSLAKTKLRPN